MSWIFCWLPLDSSSARRLGEVRGRGTAPATPSPSRRATSRGTPVEPGEEDELVEDDHPRVQAALLGQVAPRRARQRRGVGPAARSPGRGRRRGRRGRSASSSSCRRRSRRGSRRSGPAGPRTTSPSRATTRPKRLGDRSIDKAHRPSIARPSRIAPDDGPGACDDDPVTHARSVRAARRGVRSDRRRTGVADHARSGSTPIAPRGRSHRMGRRPRHASTTPPRCAGCARARTAAARPGCRAGSTRARR